MVKYIILLFASYVVGKIFKQNSLKPLLLGKVKNMDVLNKLNAKVDFSVEKENIVVTIEIPRRGITPSEQKLIKDFTNSFVADLVTKLAGGLITTFSNKK